jgi:hypothetical protein
MKDGPLSDIRVIEMGHVIAAPMCGALLSDFGADVIKIERPGQGDMLRALSARASDGVGAWWKTLARNKRLVALDWKSDEGRDVLRRLVEGAQVLIENFRPGVLERAGLAPEILHEWNPDLVIVRISGYWQTGPRASWPGFGDERAGTYHRLCRQRTDASRISGSRFNHRPHGGLWRDDGASCHSERQRPGAGGRSGHFRASVAPDRLPRADAHRRGAAG